MPSLNDCSKRSTALPKLESRAHARRQIRTKIRETTMANTKALEHDERKVAKRKARAAAPAKTARTTPRGSNKKKMKTAARGTSKR